MSNGMKSICITGKHNTYQMKKIISDVERKNETGKMELDKEFYCHRIQLDLIKKLYHIEDETPLQYVSAVPVFVRHIKEKLNGYLSQDRLQKRVNTGEHISYMEALEKIVDCGQRCYYCSDEVLLLYTVSRETMQWTLDRIDNDVRHSVDNVVVSCLGCNLSKRRRDTEGFRATKQLVLHKCPDEEEEDVLDMCDVFECVGPDIYDPFSLMCSSIEYSQDA